MPPFKIMLGSSKVSCVRQSYSVLTFLLSRVFLKKVSFLLNWELSDQTKRSEVRFRIVIWQRVPIDSGKSSSHHRVWQISDEFLVKSVIPLPHSHTVRHEAGQLLNICISPWGFQGNDVCIDIRNSLHYIHLFFLSQRETLQKSLHPKRINDLVSVGLSDDLVISANLLPPFIYMGLKLIAKSIHLLAMIRFAKKLAQCFLVE